MSEGINITIGGETRVGLYPRIPVRMLLDQRRREAMGWSSADLKALIDKKPDDEPVTPSEEPDAYALQCIYYAAVGVCMPVEEWPTLRSCRHDVVEYGEGVCDYMVTKGGAEAVRELAVEGRRLLRDMVADANALLVQDVAEEKAFTEARGEHSTSA